MLARQKMRAIPAHILETMRGPNDKLQLQGLPTLEQAIDLPYQRIISILQLCPMSRYFGVTAVSIMIKHKKKVEAMIELAVLINVWT